jgi:hypothetical protein
MRADPAYTTATQDMLLGWLEFDITISEMMNIPGENIRALFFLKNREIYIFVPHGWIGYLRNRRSILWPQIHKKISVLNETDRLLIF